MAKMRSIKASSPKSFMTASWELTLKITKMCHASLNHMCVLSEQAQCTNHEHFVWKIARGLAWHIYKGVRRLKQSASNIANARPMRALCPMQLGIVAFSRTGMLWRILYNAHTTQQLTNNGIANVGLYLVT